MAKAKHSNKPVKGRRMKQRQLLTALIAVLFIMGSGIVWWRSGAQSDHAHSASAENIPHTHEGESVEAPHLHGMGYSADGERLFIAAHNGLRVYAGNEWLVPDVPAHDYMGYSPTDDGFYSSGHPQPNTGLVNPLGLVRSADEGRTIGTLGFDGESDFHNMATGYRSHAVYVFNTSPNSGMGIGLYRTSDEGKTWALGAFKGVTGDVIQLAVHPDTVNTVAIATSNGVFLSEDGGNNFASLEQGKPVTAVAFTHDGSALYYGAQSIRKYDLGTQQQDDIDSPPVTLQDAISFIAFNPIHPAEMVVATFERNIYRRVDGNVTWQPLMRAGQALS